MLQQTLQDISRAFRAMTEDYEREIEQKPQDVQITSNLVEELEGVKQACEILFTSIENHDLLMQEILEYARESDP